MFEIKIPSIFILFLTFLFLWVWNLKKNQKKYEQSKNDFWEKEQESLVVRKKEISDNLFFKPSIAELTFPTIANPNLQTKYEKLIHQIKDSLDLPMLNLRHMSNTEIRLAFGTANQTFITQSEENYDAFLGFLYDYAIIMKDNGEISQAIKALEEAVRLKSDSSKFYILLDELYTIANVPNRIEKIEILSKGLPPISQRAILETLRKEKN